MRSFLLAMQFLTRIPVTVRGEVTEKQLGASFAWYPVIGMLIGMVSGLAAWGLGFAVEQPFLPAAVAMLVTLSITGGFHVDGLGDTADGLYAGRGDREKTLSVMKDSRVGAMAVMAISADLILRVLCLTGGGEVTWRVIFLYAAAAACGRLAVTAAAAWSHPASGSGLSGALLEHVNVRQFLIALLLAVPVCILGAGPVPGAAALAVALAGAGMATGIFKKKLGGMTGDLLGMLNEAVEVLLLVALPILTKWL